MSKITGLSCKYATNHCRRTKQRWLDAATLSSLKLHKSTISVNDLQDSYSWYTAESGLHENASFDINCRISDNSAAILFVKQPLGAAQEPIHLYRTSGASPAS